VWHAHEPVATRGGAATGVEQSDQAECRTVGGHWVDRGSQPGNFTERRTHPEAVAAVGWSEAVGGGGERESAQWRLGR
jgi:hypothetical protein